MLNACASGLGLKTESEQVRWLTTISDPTEDRIQSQNSPADRQAVPHGKSAPADRGWREGTAAEGYEEPTRLPPGRLNAPEQAHELDQHRHDEK